MLRVYALYECSRRLLRYLAGSGVLLIIIPCVRYFLLSLPSQSYSSCYQWALFDQMSTPPSIAVGGCHVGLTTRTYVYFLSQTYGFSPLSTQLFICFSHSAIRKFCRDLSNLNFDWLPLLGVAAAWEALLAFDSIIFGLTLYKTWKTRRDYAHTGIEMPLISLLLRDGTMQFEFPPNT